MSNRFRKSQLLSMPLIAMISLNSQVSISAEAAEKIDPTNPIVENIFGKFTDDVNFTIVSGKEGIVGKVNENNTEIKYLKTCVRKQIGNLVTYVSGLQDVDALGLTALDFEAVLCSKVRIYDAHKKTQKITLFNDDANNQMDQYQIKSEILPEYAQFMSTAFFRCLSDKPSSYITRLMQVLIALDTKLLSDDLDDWRDINEAKEYLAEFLYVSDMALDELRKSPTLVDEPSMMLLSIMLDGTLESKSKNNELYLNPFEIQSNEVVGIKEGSNIVKGLTDAITALRTGVKDVIAKINNEDTHVVTTDITTSMMANDVYNHLSEKYTIGNDKVSDVKRAIRDKLTKQEVTKRTLASDPYGASIIKYVSDQIDIDNLLGEMISEDEVKSMLGMKEFNKIHAKISEQIDGGTEVDLDDVINAIVSEAKKHTAKIKDKQKLLFDIIDTTDYTQIKTNEQTITTPDSLAKDEEVTTTLKLAIDGFNPQLKVTEKALNTIADLKTLYNAGKAAYDDFNKIRATSVFKDGNTFNDINDEINYYKGMKGYELWLARYEAYSDVTSIVNASLKGDLTEEQRQAAETLKIMDEIENIHKTTEEKEAVEKLYNKHYKKPATEEKTETDWLLRKDGDEREQIIEQYRKKEYDAIKDNKTLNEQQRNARRNNVDTQASNMRNYGADACINSDGKPVITEMALSDENYINAANELRQKGITVISIKDQNGTEQIVYIPDPDTYKKENKTETNAPSKEPLQIAEVLGSDSEEINKIIRQYIPAKPRVNEPSAEINKSNASTDTKKGKKGKKGKKKTPKTSELDVEAGRQDLSKSQTISTHPQEERERMTVVRTSIDQSKDPKLNKDKETQASKNKKKTSKKIIQLMGDLSPKQENGLKEITMDNLIAQEFNGVLSKETTKKEAEIGDVKAVLMAYSIYKAGGETNLGTKEQLTKSVTERITDGFKIAGYKVQPEKEDKTQDYISENTTYTQDAVTDSLIWDIVDGKIMPASISNITPPKGAIARDITVTGDDLTNVIKYTVNGKAITPSDKSVRIDEILGSEDIGDSLDACMMRVYIDIKMGRYNYTPITTQNGSVGILTNAQGNIVRAGSKLITERNVEEIEKEISDRISHPQSTDDKIIELIYNDLENKNEDDVKDDNREQGERRTKNDEAGDDRRIIISAQVNDEEEISRAALADELKKITESSSESDLAKMLEGRGDEEIKSNMENIVKAVNACLKFTGKETELKIGGKKLLDIQSHKEYLEAENNKSSNTIIDGKIHMGELDGDDVIKICKGLIAQQQEKEESEQSGDIESLAQLTELIGLNDTAILEDEEIKKAVTSAIKTIVTNINESDFNKKLSAVLKELAKAGGITDHKISDNELGKLIEERMISTGYEWEVNTEAGKMSTGSENYDIEREIPGKPKSEGQTMLKGRKLVKAQKSDLARTIALGEKGEIKNDNAAKKMIGLILTDADYRQDLQKCIVTGSFKINEGGTITIKLGSVTHTIKIASPTMSEKSFKKIVENAKKYPEYIQKGDLNKIASDSDGTYKKQYYAAKATTE